jgi:hypothetical protein
MLTFVLLVLLSSLQFIAGQNVTDAQPVINVIKLFFSSSLTKEGKSAASFCCQVAAWVPDVFLNFYVVKNHKIAKKTQQSLKLEKK